MSEVPRRHISKLGVRIALPAGLDDRQRKVLEAGARGCPICASLGPDTEGELRFEYQ